MRTFKTCMTSGCLFLTAFIAVAQEPKPGLYEMTITTATVSPARKTSRSQGAHPVRTIQACLSQQMLDRYGAIVPEYLANVCQLTNVVKNPQGMTADMVCSGHMTGKGTIVVNWTDSEHSKGKIHFSGTMRPGEDAIKLEWNTDTTATYKGPDCGDLKPPTP
jgi:hypothetical protein